MTQNTYIYVCVNENVLFHQLAIFTPYSSSKFPTFDLDLWFFFFLINFPILLPPPRLSEQSPPVPPSGASQTYDSAIV